MKKERQPRPRKLRWLGGYIHVGDDDRRTYVLERWNRGNRVHVSTGCTTLAGAMAELARFEADPLRYRPGGGVVGGVMLTEALADAYAEHQKAQGVTAEWIGEVSRCLGDWAEAFGGKDLRGLSLHGDLLPALERWRTRRPHRIKALKGFFRFLRQTKGVVERGQDPTLDLRVPQARPEKHRRRKVVPPEDVSAVLKRLPAVSRDILHLLSATAWHVSEVRRFAAGGEIVKPLGAVEVLAVLITRHKSGDLTKTPVLYPEHLAAAERIRALERFPKRMTIARHMRRACADAGVPWFGMGQMRHSVLTWGVADGGASVQDAADFAHHRSQQTTRRYYLDIDIPRPAIPVYRLT